jgi:hypothetical protein
MRDGRDGVRSIFSISWGMKLLLFLGSGALSRRRCYSMPGSVAYSLKSTTLFSPLISLAHFATVKIQFIVERWTERVFRKRRRCRWRARARITNDALRVDAESSYPMRNPAIENRCRQSAESDSARFSVGHCATAVSDAVLRKSRYNRASTQRTFDSEFP